MNNNKLKRSLVTTEDGSHTLYVPELNEHYHSIHGAIQESKHVFIDSGFSYLENLNEIAVFEVGFGTGLNAMLTYVEACKKNTRIKYAAVEKYPITAKELKALNYHTLIDGCEFVFNKMHKVCWNEELDISEKFVLHKIQSDLTNLKLEHYYNLVYFDAFAPDLQPDLWSLQIFKNLYEHMYVGGVLVTYSAKGFVKRNLAQAGFMVTKIPGPPGKREMIRALKI